MAATITLPESVLQAIRVLDRFIRRILAVELYREGRLSLGKAAEVAGVRNKWEMVMLLDEKGVALDYSAEDAEQDLNTLKKYLGRPNTNACSRDEDHKNHR
jgi:predicted HTH domain antitoxin